MIKIYATPDAQDQGEAIAEVLAEAYPDLAIATVGPTDALLGGAGGPPAWDDLLLVVFGTEGLPEALHDPIRREVQAAAVRQGPSRVMPVSTQAGHLRPPPPLDAVKAIHCPDPARGAGQRLAHRVGALLGLWLRGEDLKVFVSHRQADGAALAAQVAGHLRQQGYNAWLDADRLECCAIVQDEIERHVAGAHLLLLLDTPQARDSEWIWKEVDAAIRGFVPIVPVVLRPAGSTGEAAAPGFRNAAELFSHRIQVRLDGDGALGLLDRDALDGLLAAAEDYLSRVLRSQRALAAKVEDSFRDAGFDWQVLDSQRHFYSSSKADEDVGLTRFLSHCSAVSPRFFGAVRALQEYRVANAGTGGAAASFNHRLFVYEPPLPGPELTRLYRDYGFDPVQLRLLDTGRLRGFLNRYQTNPET